MNPRIFGRELNRLREESGMTEQVLADRLHVREEVIRAWEAGDSFPDLQQAMAAAVLLFKSRAVTEFLYGQSTI